MSGKLIKNECFAVKKVSKTALKSVFAFPIARTKILKDIWKDVFFILLAMGRVARRDNQQGCRSTLPAPKF